MQLQVNLPKKISTSIGLFFAVIIFSSQLLLKTSIEYASLIFLFVMLTIFTVNKLGGLTTVSGFLIGMMALKIVIISQCAKIILMQPSDSNLESPVLTAAVMTIGIASIYLASLVVRTIRIKKIICNPSLDQNQLHILWLLSFLLGLACILYVQFDGFKSSGELKIGGLIGIARQFAYIYNLSIVAATAHTLMISGNQRSLGFRGLISITVGVVIGFINMSKLGIFEPFFCYYLTCIAFRFKFRGKHILTSFFLAWLAVTYVFPIVQVGRNYIVREDFLKSSVIAYKFVFHPDEELLRSNLAAFSKANYHFQYFGKDMGILDRFSLIDMADSLVSSTTKNGQFGWSTIVPGFKMVPPRFLYPDKPIYNTGNFLGHRIGILQNDDETTQIAFGFIAESFGAFGLLGVLLIPFILMLSFFLIYSKLSGDIYGNIWTVFLISIFQHSFTEDTISAMILAIIQFPAIFLLSYFLLTGIVAFSKKIAS